MKLLIIFTLTAVLWVFAQNAELDGKHDEIAYQQFSYALQNAVHDAALQLSAPSVSDGFIDMDAIKADAVFRQILAENLNLDNTTLTPNPTSIFKAAPTIQLEVILDNSNTAFPYHYVNPQYGIDVQLTGPAFICAVTIPAPRQFNSSPTFNLRWSAVEEAPPP